MDYPKLRAVEAFPAQEGTICIRDPMGYSEKMLLLPIDIYFICAHFDGNHSILDIQAAYTRRFGDLLFSDKVREIIEKLDSCFFLENERFEKEKARIIEAFRADPIRRATHAGSAYEAEPDALKKQLDAMLEGADGSPGGNMSEVEPLPGSEPNGRLQGIMAPHIDPRRGGPCYAASYRELARSSQADLFVILGVSHNPTARRYVLTRKSFQTPLGEMQTDQDFVDELTGQHGEDLFADEYVHSGEHSIEFQVLFLQHLLGGRKDISMVPILCSSFLHQLGREGEVPAEVEGFLSSLRQAVISRGDRVCCIAAVDLSHLGRRFGQDTSLSPGMVSKAEREDREMLELVMGRNHRGFLKLIAAEQDRRNVCGVPGIYALLRILEPGEAKLLRYEIAEEPQTQSLVSFASAAFYARSEA